MSGQPNPELAALVEELMGRLPASPNGTAFDPAETGKTVNFHLTQRDIDIIFAALSHHHSYAETGWHEDADEREIDPNDIAKALEEFPALIDLIDDLEVIGVYGQNRGEIAVGLIRESIMRMYRSEGLGPHFAERRRARETRAE